MSLPLEHSLRRTRGAASAAGGGVTLSGARSAAIWALAAALAGAAAALGLAADVSSAARLRFALMHVLVVLVPVGVGLYATRHEAHRRFGHQLIIAGFVWSTAALAQSDSSVPYSIGRFGGWVVTFVLVYLVLAYPTGRLTGLAERVIAAGGLFVLCVGFVPTALLVDAYPAHAPWTACGLDCPPNAFMVVDSQPGFLASWVFPVRDVLLIALYLATLVVVVARAVRATYLRRRTVVPVLVPFGLQIAFLIAFVTLRRTNPDGAAAEPLGWLFAIAVPAVALGFLAGLVRWRFYVAGALERVTLAMSDAAAPRDLRATLAEAITDPPLEIAIRRDGGWVDPDGEPRAEPVADADRALTPVQQAGVHVATLIHDDALAEDPAFTSSLAACTATLLERRRMLATVGDGLRELEDLRTRLMADVDVERKRMERDLHDGVQQRLVVLGIKLGMAGDRLAEGQAPGSAALRELEGEVDIIIDEIRSLSQGVHPSVLVERGLEDALRAVAGRAPLTVAVEARGVGRHPREVETAVYFACAEALQNVVKHARAARATVTLREDGALSFEVADDGAGFREDPDGPGSGVANMRQRLAEIGGTLTISSVPGLGTRVAGSVPLAPPRCS